MEINVFGVRSLVVFPDAGKFPWGSLFHWSLLSYLPEPSWIILVERPLVFSGRKNFCCPYTFRCKILKNLNIQPESTLWSGFEQEVCWWSLTRNVWITLYNNGITQVVVGWKSISGLKPTLIRRSRYGHLYRSTTGTQSLPRIYKYWLLYLRAFHTKLIVTTVLTGQFRVS